MHSKRYIYLQRGGTIHKKREQEKADFYIDFHPDSDVHEIRGDR